MLIGIKFTIYILLVGVAVIPGIISVANLRPLNPIRHSY